MSGDEQNITSARDRRHDGATTTHGERLAVLEQRFDHADVLIEKMGRKVDEMHAFLLQAKGAKWAFIVLWAAAGGALTTLGYVLSHLRWP